MKDDKNQRLANSIVYFLNDRKNKVSFLAHG